MGRNDKAAVPLASASAPNDAQSTEWAQLAWSKPYLTRFVDDYDAQQSFVEHVRMVCCMLTFFLLLAFHLMFIVHIR
jgi:hypothetical protein